MKNIFINLIVLCVFLAINIDSYAQGVAINPTSNPPDPSAILDVSSTTQGALLPRMNSSERDAIDSPAEGLQIFNTTTKCTQMYVYDLWQNVWCATCPGPSQPDVIAGNGSICQGSIQNYSVTNEPGVTYSWSYSGTGFSCTGGCSTNAITAQFTASATSGTLTVTPSFTCATGPAQTKSIMVDAPLSAPVAASHNPSETQIVWNWQPVSGAAGYKYHTSDNYAGAIDIGDNTGYTQTGLACGTGYNLYVWAYNACGQSSSVLLSQNTSVCPFVCGSSTVTFTYRGSSVTYGTVSSAGGRCWLNRNLGASQVAASFNDAAAYGDLVQWGRLDDGHQSRTSSVTSTRSATDVPGHNNYIAGAFSDWRLTSNNALWQGVSGTNNPCPSGWRIPTETEWTTERSSWSNVNYTGAFSSPLKLTAAGYRIDDASLYQVGTNGYYATSTVSGGNARFVYTTSSSGGFDSNGRSTGSSVRCIRD